MSNREWIERAVSFLHSIKCVCRYYGDGDISTCGRCALLETVPRILASDEDGNRVTVPTPPKGETMKHTETPPMISAGKGIDTATLYDHKGRIIGELFGAGEFEDKALGAAVVGRYNAHDGLVAALRKLDNYLYELQRANIIAGDLQRDLIRNALRAAGEEV